MYLSELPLDILPLILDVSPYPSLRKLQLVSHHFTSATTEELLSRKHSEYNDEVFNCEQEIASYVRNLPCSLAPPVHVCTQHELPASLVASYPDLLVTADRKLSSFCPSSTQLPCYTCFRFRPLDHFGKFQTTASKQLGHKNARHRICIPCGVKTGRYPLGKVLHRRGNGNPLSGTRVVLCRSCGKIKTLPREQVKGLNPALGLCVSCWDPESYLSAQEQSLFGIKLDSLSPTDGKSQSHKSTRCWRCWAHDHTVRDGICVKADYGGGTESLCRECLKRRGD